MSNSLALEKVLPRRWTSLTLRSEKRGRNFSTKKNRGTMADHDHLVNVVMIDSTGLMQILRSSCRDLGDSNSSTCR